MINPASSVPSCLACLRPVSAGPYHVQCLRRVFGSDNAPVIDLTEATLRTVALTTIGHTTVSGAQPKISLGLVRDRRKTLRVATGGRERFILKPQTAEFPAIPENEHLSMQIARFFGLLTPPNALVRLADGGLAYIVERFDRPAEGGKRRQEDFCQLRGLPPSAKYEGTAVECAEVIERYSSRSRADLIRLFETYVLSYWVGNGDLHLKNLSLLADASGRYSLSPAYDIVCVSLYEGYESRLVLPLSRADKLATRDAWLRFADLCLIPRPAALAILRRPTERQTDALALVEQSYLPAVAMKARYADVLQARAAVLLGEIEP